jgi:hypothetical protein
MCRPPASLGTVPPGAPGAPNSGDMETPPTPPWPLVAELKTIEQ